MGLRQLLLIVAATLYCTEKAVSDGYWVSIITHFLHLGMVFMTTVDWWVLCDCWD